MGHSRLITNGLSDNQPVIKNNIAVIHNGIIVNHDNLWPELDEKRAYEIDTEIINALVIDCLKKSKEIEEIPLHIFKKCKGTISAGVLLADLGKLILLSNNGSLYIGYKKEILYFSSEEFPLSQIGCSNVKQILNDYVIIDVPKSTNLVENDYQTRTYNLIPEFVENIQQEKLLEYPDHQLKRCKKCILPETMPYIHFDDQGVCNYCNNYTPRNAPKPKEELFNLVEPYRKVDGADCIVPFSGGRDSCYALHLIVNELKMKPVTYTYDWGMVTDLGRRNISRMCSELGVENIIISDDIEKKRKNIAMNLKAWLKSPHLGMISIFTAGDKHFFRHVETVKRQTGINLNLWGVNPLEVTHFKAGFLGIKPDFEETKVYNNGVIGQLNYQALRLKAMSKSPSYFNSSLWDTFSGEYYRSFLQKTDYYHIFDYWSWNERLSDQTLAMYDWELAPDTTTTWRIGDGTAAFYNYIYYKVAGFTEHDTFRSNQIRENQITRKEALALVAEENRPRYQNLRWYLDTLQMDFEDTIQKINNIPSLY